MKIVLKTGLNADGEHHAASLVSSGQVDKTSDWSFSAADGDKLLGSGGDDWANYAKWFMGTDGAADVRTKEHYKYPFGKDGKVFRSALVAIRSRSAQEGADAIFAAAGRLIDKIDGKAMPLGKAAPGMLQRAYSQFDIKHADEEQRILRGVATTPTPDRMGDIVEPMGAAFELPIPFLWQHDAEQPIGHVINAKATKNGINVDVQLAKVDEPGKLKDRLDEAWQSIKAMLVRGLSIGFSPVEYSYMEDTGGYRFMKWAWLELSAVTIPANAEASIAMIKSYDGTRSLIVAKKRPIITLPPRKVKTVPQKPVRSFDSQLCSTIGELIDEKKATLSVTSIPGKGRR